MRDAQREAETQAEGEAHFMQGAQCETRSRDQDDGPEPKADAQPLYHTGFPFSFVFKMDGVRKWI